MKHKVVYTATNVTCGWAGAVIRKANPSIWAGAVTQQVIQGLHMVSGNLCPAWSDQLKEWSESRTAASMGQCPEGHMGEFPVVLSGHI